MAVESASRPTSVAAASNNVRASLDAVDTRIVAELSADARLPNNALAERVGIAASTCLARVRSLRERGVIRGYYADVDPAALGRPLQAMISVRLQSGARGHLSGFAEKMAALPEVLNVFFLGGADDFLVHIATEGSQTLRDFVVVHLSSDPDVALTETNLIFDHLRAGLTH
ncbi:MAG TPA: Lrp/AsnC family transcriptional regulator [Jatrophihabitantaceae bacterium]|jgi:DNA-binding Lrp family transcriptional regulator|nr:Lrp/AsnC family transcriptional regulator [Amycolatopsis sp.]HZY76439.1 Lrp/AsnC family transcriptional regulator [Jatrophihabitantaceae bacterium]